MKVRKRVLVIEPYYGGSHRAFLEGVRKHVDADFTFLTLPARKWKMRMQLSAPWFAAQIEAKKVEERWFDAVLCSTFVDVAVLRALLQQITGWNPRARYCTYFHENQFVYPGQIDDVGIHQFTAINFTTALVSDGLAFNSHFNLQSFLKASGRYVKKAADMNIHSQLEAVEEKSTVLHPGIDFERIDRAERKGSEGAVIVWNHRWEHDKNPEEFFAALQSLKEKGLHFKLVVLGQSFSTQPACFAMARELFHEDILHFGYAESREEYAALLKCGSIVVSTAVHEFFGISVLEAVRAGCRPVLPERLSYPELFSRDYLYGEGELEQALARAVEAGGRLNAAEAFDMTQKHSWTSLAGGYKGWLLGESQAAGE